MSVFHDSSVALRNFNKAEAGVFFPFCVPFHCMRIPNDINHCGKACFVCYCNIGRICPACEKFSLWSLCRQHEQKVVKVLNPEAMNQGYRLIAMASAVHD